MFESFGVPTLNISIEVSLLCLGMDARVVLGSSPIFDGFGLPGQLRSFSLVDPMRSSRGHGDQQGTLCLCIDPISSRLSHAVSDTQALRPSRLHEFASFMRTRDGSLCKGDAT